MRRSCNSRFLEEGEVQDQRKLRQNQYGVPKTITAPRQWIDCPHGGSPSGKIDAESILSPVTEIGADPGLGCRIGSVHSRPSLNMDTSCTPII